MNRYLSAILLLLMFLPGQLMSQGKKVSLLQAEYMHQLAGENFQRAVGNAIFEHEGAYMYCDSAHLNTTANILKAFGNVRIQASDTLNLFSNYAEYNGNTRIAVASGDVKLVDNQTVLTSNRLTFNRNTGVAYYLENGHIVNSQNTLDSRIGHYNTNTKEFLFRGNVVMHNEEYDVHCDTMRYNTVSKISHFFGPTTIKGEDIDVYAENGWFDSNNDISQFYKNAIARNGDQTLTGDSLYYDRRNAYGRAVGNVVVTDTVQNLIATGGFAEYIKNKGYSLITQRPEVQLIEDNDTLFMHADTLRAHFNDKRETESLHAYSHAKYFRPDIQGMADSIAYSFADSTMRLYKDPVIWNDENQLTADTIVVTSVNKRADKLYMYSRSFIINRDYKGFNQIKGRNMEGFFRDNELVKMNVNGNAQSLYWVREENEALIGINVATASDMIIRLNNRKVRSIVFLVQPVAVLYPEKDLPEAERKLEGFSWKEDRRPKRREDIFTW